MPPGRQEIIFERERCFSAKCAFTKKPYAPGQHSKKGAILSEYGRQLAAKQTIKRVYGVREKQFRKYFQDSKKKEGNFGDILIGRLESRLDNLVYRFGFTQSRVSARQLVSHGFLLVNDKPVNIPSQTLKPGDTVTIRPSKEGRKLVTEMKERLTNKKQESPAWVEVDPKKLTGKLLTVPGVTDVNPDADPQMIVEFYSR